jgi:DNA-binding MarR family transcriptional regulator
MVRPSSLHQSHVPRAPSLMPDEQSNTSMEDFCYALLGTLEPFKDLKSEIPHQVVLTFLLVACKQGLSVTDYAQRAGVSKSVMSRHLLDLGERNRHMEPGLGLVVSKPSPLELRRHEVYLTPKGKAMLARMQRELERTYTYRKR